MSKFTICQKPTYTTCRQVYRAMQDSGVDFESINYYVEPIPKSKLKELLKKMRMKAKDLLRTKEHIYKELRLGEKELIEDEVIELMMKHPDLIQRPIVEKGARASWLAQPNELKKFFNCASPPP